SWEVFQKYGFYSYEAILRGKYLGLITPVFVHFDFFHIAFNLLFFSAFSSKIEKSSGSIFLIIFILISALISTSAQLFFSGTTGIGISGVVFAMIGFLW